MSDLYWLSDVQMARLAPYFPKSHGKPRVDDRRVLSGIIFINRNGLRWRDAPKEYGPHKTLYNRWKRWSDKGIFAQMMAGLAPEAPQDRGISACIPGRKQRKATVRYDKRRLEMPCPEKQTFVPKAWDDQGSGTLQIFAKRLLSVWSKAVVSGGVRTLTSANDERRWKADHRP